MAASKRSLAPGPEGGVLEITDLTVRFGGIVALDGVSFSLQPGEITGLIGPNGAGKTTLFNCLSRLYDWQKGEIRFAGEKLSGVQTSRMAGLGIGRTFQNLALFDTMSVRDNILVGRHCRTHSGFVANGLRLVSARREEEASRLRADEIIAFLDLEDVADRIAGDLPFGTRKRIELGRALLSDPQLLLLDEPAAGLNHDEVGTLGRLICQIRDSLGISVLLVEHHMALVMSVSDKVVALNFGRKIAEGSPQQVQEHPEVIAAYLGVE